MAFWLARDRRGQSTDWIPRFDPRFWTVNFPRPMMASVVTAATDAMRVDCEFHHQGELCGLIWDSEDTLDHPLLAYETERDYSRCTLSFRWRSEGIVALDQPHGPTLTIEGRDATGASRTWYVRLWNYASGSPSDARITIPFSDLESGFNLPGEAIHPGEIDRMFISLVPSGYVEGSSQPLAARVNGWAEVSDIECTGERAMIAIGDVLLPPHGEHMATAYDDSLNQTPARLLRAMTGLGYRGRVVHYVGMSHYFRLRYYGSKLYANYAGIVCEPAVRWHESYFREAVGHGFEPIVSLSFELLEMHCPSWWRQRAWDGTYAQTGWEPPSALLSATNAGNLAFLSSIATQFTSLLESAGGKVLFQIGEPWWWTIAETGAPCLYDNATRNLYGSEIVAITDMRAPLSQAQIDFLDEMGSHLAAATATVTQAVRDAAAGEVETMLLVFTPTLLDQAMPELWRANLPWEWAYPAFDRIQVEDYDWLTAGADAARRAGYDFVSTHLGYPPDATDYLSGFVLRAEDADRYWPLIDRGLDEARARGIADRYVWALPQVQRDGYTRLPFTEDDVQAFDDVAYPLPLGRDAAAAPEFSTTIAVTSSGHEFRNALWSDARMRYDVGPGVRSEAELGELIGFFRARFGPARGFRLRDPFDHSSNGMTGTPGPLDQLLGTGNGLSDRFRLTKSYGEQVRPITRPEIASLRVSVDGAETGGWSFEPGGWIVFDTAPGEGADIRAGFLFDVPVRFADDRIDVNGLSFAAGEAPSVPLIEIREAA